MQTISTLEDHRRQYTAKQGSLLYSVIVSMSGQSSRIGPGLSSGTFFTLSHHCTAHTYSLGLQFLAHRRPTIIRPPPPARLSARIWRERINVHRRRKSRFSTYTPTAATGLTLGGLRHIEQQASRVRVEVTGISYLGTNLKEVTDDICIQSDELWIYQTLNRPSNTPQMPMW